jgi:hypothetical protein
VKCSLELLASISELISRCRDSTFARPCAARRHFHVTAGCLQERVRCVMQVSMVPAIY